MIEKAFRFIGLIFLTLACAAVVMLVVIAAMLCRAIGVPRERVGRALCLVKHTMQEFVEDEYSGEQAAIFVLGMLGATLLAIGGDAARWGFLAALAGQPFWIYETWHRKQWGILALSCWFTLAWGYGAARAWVGM